MVEPLIVFPTSLMRAASVEWNLTASSSTPGQNGSGSFNFQRLDGGGLWLAKMNLIRLLDKGMVAAYRAMRIAARGGVTMLEIPREDILQPWPLDGSGNPITSFGSIPHSDLALFSDGSGYSQSVITAYSVGAAANRATTMVIHFEYGGPLLGGEAFSIRHPYQNWRMYEISKVEINDDGDSVVTFDPPLREATTDGTRIEMDLLRCTMRAASVDAMDFTLETRPFSRPSATFIESFYPV